MTEDTRQLKREVFSSESPSRGLVVKYLQAIVDEAKKLPVEGRDDLAAEILMPFNQLSHPPEEDPDIEYIVSELAGGTLDILTEDLIRGSRSRDRIKYRRIKAEIWEELVDRVEQLHI